MRRTIALNDIAAVGSDSKATVRIVDTVAIHYIILTFTNIALAKIGRIRLFYNDKEAHSWKSGAHLDSILQYFGCPAFGATTQLIIPLAALGMLEQSQQEGTAVHLGVPYKDGTTIKSMRLEIDLGSALVSPMIKAKAICRDSVANLEPWFPFTRETTIDVQSTGQKVISDLVDTKSNREAFATQVFFEASAAEMTRLLVQRNGVDVHDRDVAENNRIQLAGVRNPQAGWYVMDTREDGYGNAADALSAGDAQTLQWKPDFGTAKTYTAYVCTIGRLN